MKIAVVGAGVSGLVAAHLLAPEHDVTVFEAAPTPAAIRTRCGSTRRTRRTGSTPASSSSTTATTRASSGCSDRSASARQPSNMSFAVTDTRGDFEYASTSPNGLFAKRAHLATPWFHRMLADLVRFQREARKLLSSDATTPRSATSSTSTSYSRAFVDRLIVPQAAAVWSADPRQMWSFPARFLIEFFDNHGMLGLTRPPEVADGPGRLAPLRRGAHRAVAGAAAARHAGPTPSRRHDDHVEVTSTGEPERFDHVVLATHSDQALKLLADPTDREHELLGAIPYQANEAVLHTDKRLLPRRRRAWASWNYHLLDEPTGKPTVTYHMNRLQSLRAEREFCVTLNHSRRDRPRQGHPHDPVRAPRLHRGGPGRPGTATTRSAARTARTTAARTGAGASMRTASKSGERVPAWRHRCDRERDLRGRRSATAASRCGITRSATGSRWPTSTSTSCPTLLDGRLTRSAPRPRALPPQRLPRRSRGRRSTTRSARSSHERLGHTPQGPIRLLTHLRTLGHCFNPVSFYYCFAPDGETLEAIVAEVTNTPWGERHAYV